MHTRNLTAVVLPFISLFSIGNAQSTSGASLSDVLSKNDNLSSYSNLLRQQFPAILETFEQYNAQSTPITLLVPSNHAFEQMQYSETLSAAFANNDTAVLQQLIAYHALSGLWTSKTLNTTFKFLPSMTSGTNFSAVSGGQRVGAVLQPPNPNTTFEHEMVFTSQAGTRSVVTFQDVPFAGGFIQVIDNFLIPPVGIAPTIETFQLAYTPFAMTAFLGAVYSNPNNTRLAKYLNETRDLTVFVPANIAVEVVSNSLSSMDLTELLEYHVLTSDHGPLYSSDFANDTTLHTMNNKTLSMRFLPNSFFVNQARVLTQDILLYNGVLHIIDGVLSPNSTDRLPNPTSATQMPVLPTNPNAAQMNVSMPPFTTYLPNDVSTEVPTTTATLDGYAVASSTYTDAATSMSTKKSSAHRVGVAGVGRDWVLVWITCAGTLMFASIGFWKML
ncbi:Hypothetical predicted protein [Lecanosticta acicola]|uniref:FAS1 domain-containing protein n=1 Tax=Lecanosticta acicola TaxID=111012 RepID=A0AAI9E839_9PEZI|nr:Hypothetical predicted protein [Lecanosticta acicola]